MAEAKHYKLSRKDLREPDEFQAITTQTVDWLRANQSAVVGAVSTILAIGAVVLGVGWYSGHQADAAAVKLQAAQTLFEQKKFAEAATEFADVSATYPRTPSGRLATLYRAHALAEEPDPAAAAAAYGEYLATTPPTDYLRQQALLGMAQAQEATKDTPAATQTYQQAADIDGPFRTQAQLALARLEEAAGAPDKARALYAEIVKAPDLDAETRQAISAKLPASAAPANEAAPVAE
jgi:predicted negative regulator of RcsB-dependent stress response